MKYPPKSLGIRRAMDLLALPGHRLMIMADNRSPTGKSHYIVPGGYIDPDDAERIKSHPAVRVLDDGLLDGHPQSWCIGEWKK